MLVMIAHQIQLAYCQSCSNSLYFNEKMRFVAFILCFGIWTISHAQEFEVDGDVQIGASENESPDPGTIRWTGTDFVGWNGTKWVSLTIPRTYHGQMEDFDGNQYNTIQIGDQIWMAENLRTTSFANGTPIEQISDSIAWFNADTSAWCWYQNDSASYEIDFGKLYNWYAVNDQNGLCPTGWKVPSTSDIDDLFNHYKLFHKR